MARLTSTTHATLRARNYFAAWCIFSAPGILNLCKAACYSLGKKRQLVSGRKSDFILRGGESGIGLNSYHNIDNFNWWHKAPKPRGFRRHGVDNWRKRHFVGWLTAWRLTAINLHVPPDKQNLRPGIANETEKSIRGARAALCLQRNTKE